tara:strand:- start:525 stop:2888 length:2364 start_codon:yes stop_codon:yes gene_type:complete
MYDFPYVKIFIPIIYLMVSALCAQKPAYEPEKSIGKFFEYAEFTNVGDSDYSIEDILNNKLLTYEDLNSENHDFGFTSDTYWVRFILKNNSFTNKSYYLETARPITDIANLYQIGQTIEVQKNGDQISFKEKMIPHRQIVFKISLAPQSEKEFYLKLGSDGETINLPLILYNESTFLYNNYKQQLFLGLFYGVLLLAGLIYLFFYTSLKSKVFLYYGLYVLFIAIMQGALDGFIFQYFLPNGGYLNSRMVLISALLSNFFLLKYCEFFLKIELNLPSYKRIYYAIYVVLGILFVMIFVNSTTLNIAYPLSNLNGLLSLILILTSIFRMRFKKIHIDPYFSFGIFFLVIGLLGFVMNNLGLLASNFYTINSSKFGSGFEVVFLSLSMTNLLKELREDKENSQKLALKKSEEISELKTHFMSNFSHELRTPINAIMGIVETELVSKGITKEGQENYQIIKNATFSLLSNVNDILDYEKIEKNEINLNDEVFNPLIAINQISENWKSEALKKGLDYRFEINSEIPASVSGDSDRLVQIINTVLSNAVKFTLRGSITLRLECINKSNDNCEFSFQVSDTGVGMNNENKDAIFDSFNQMRLDHKRQFGGIGLGLTIANHLISLFKGKVRVESELNKGTDVFFTLQLKEVEEKQVTTNIIDKVWNGPMHILIVEDNMLNQFVLKKMLDSFSDIIYSTVVNGKEAIDALQREKFDVVLMDLQMPIMDGYEATEIIRSGQLGNIVEKIPIIAVTADVTDEARQRVMQIGMNDYMTKPINRDLLKAKIMAYNYLVT